MLILSREVEESIIITVPGDLMLSGEPEVIQVMVTSLPVRHSRYKKVRLGIQADRRISIHRGEVQRVINANREADRV